MGIIKLGIVGYVLWMIGGSLYNHQIKMSYYWEGCAHTACRPVPFGFERVDAAVRQKARRDSSAPVLCTFYWKNDNLWDRYVRNRDIRWCEDYPQFKPAA